MSRGTALIISIAALTACGSDLVARPTTTSTTTSVSTSTTSTSTTSAPTTSPTTTTAKPKPSTASTSAVPQIRGVSAPGAASLAGKVVVVDPGHNGGNGAHPEIIRRMVDAGGFRKECNTTGTAGGDLSESKFNWETAQLVRASLSAAGATVIMTRDSNSGVGPCIDERGQIAARARADLLVSIHADGADTSAHGFHVITPTVIAGYTDATSVPSARLAAAVRDALVAEGMTTSTYVGTNGISRRGDLGTLNRAGVPAVIIECGNMANAADLALLRSDAGRQRIAAAVTHAAANFSG